jgi:hypothetical protein
MGRKGRKKITGWKSVLVRESQNIPEVVVVRRGAGGVLGSWKGDGSAG